MGRAVIGRALSARVARGGSYRRTAPPETVLAELEELPKALLERERSSRLALGIVAVPLPLALVPLGYLLADGMPPQALLLLALPIGVVALLAREGWKDRAMWWVPPGARAIELFLRGLSWSRGGEVSVIASHANAREPDRVLWSVEGALASGARLVASVARGERSREVSETVELHLAERRPWALARVEAALDQLGVPGPDRRITATSMGWSRTVPREADSDPSEVLERVRGLLSTATDAPSVPATGYRDAPSSSRDDAPAELGPIPVAEVRGDAWAARAWAAVLGSYAVVIILASTIAVATGAAPRTLGGAAVAGAGALASILLASWIAKRLVRTAPGRTDA